MRFRLVLALAVLVFAAGFIWWLGRPASIASAPPAPTPPLAPAPKAVPVAVTPAPVPAHPAEVAAPVVRPAAVSATPAATVAPAPADPRLAPDTAMADFVNMVDAGNYVSAAETYMQLPPNVSAEQFVTALEQNANFSQTVKMVQDTMHATAGLTPVYNAAGDTATYTLSPAVDGKTTVRWKNVDGVWRLDAIDN